MDALETQLMETVESSLRASIHAKQCKSPEAGSPACGTIPSSHIGPGKKFRAENEAEVGVAEEKKVGGANSLAWPVDCKQVHKAT